MTDIKERNREILQEYLSGKSTVEIGKEYNLSRQRIQQILSNFDEYRRRREEMKRGYRGKYKPKKRGKNKRINFDLRKELLKINDYITRSITISSLEDIDLLNTDIETLRQTTGISSIENIIRLIGYNSPKHVNSKKSKKYTNEDLISVLTKFYKDTGETTYKEYRKWSENLDVPSVQTFISRFNSWIRAWEFLVNRIETRDEKLAEEIQENLHEGGTKTSKYSFLETIEAIKKAHKNCSGKLTIEKYKEQDPEVPFHIIRSKHGKWKWALFEAGLYERELKDIYVSVCEKCGAYSLDKEGKLKISKSYNEYPVLPEHKRNPSHICRKYSKNKKLQDIEIEIYLIDNFPHWLETPEVEWLIDLS